MSSSALSQEPSAEVSEVPKEAGVGLMFVIASAPAKGWAVKNVIKQSPADLSGKIKEGHVLTHVASKSIADVKSLSALSKCLMGTYLCPLPSGCRCMIPRFGVETFLVDPYCAGVEGTSIALSFKVGTGKKGKKYDVNLVRSNAFLGVLTTRIL